MYRTAAALLALVTLAACTLSDRQPEFRAQASFLSVRGVCEITQNNEVFETNDGVGVKQTIQRVEFASTSNDLVIKAFQNMGVANRENPCDRLEVLLFLPSETP